MERVNTIARLLGEDPFFPSATGGRIITDLLQSIRLPLAFPHRGHHGTPLSFSSLSLLDRNVPPPYSIDPFPDKRTLELALGFFQGRRTFMYRW